MLIWLFIRAAATDVAWLPALDAGSDQKSHRKRPASILPPKRRFISHSVEARWAGVRHNPPECRWERQAAVHQPEEHTYPAWPPSPHRSPDTRGQYPEKDA